MMLIESIKRKYLQEIDISFLHHHYSLIDHQYLMLIQFVDDVADVFDNEDHLNNSHHVNQVQNLFLEEKKRKK
jgi:hypothetical protein